MKKETNFWSKRLFIHLGLMCIISILLFFLLKSGLSNFTLHGENIVVPDFVGISLEEAQVVAAEHSLELEIHDTIFSDFVDPGYIAAHIPHAGKEVKENRTIYLSINATGPVMVPMPKAFDVSLRQAKYILERNGLQVGRIDYKPDIANNYVFEQKFKNTQIETGTRIPKGSKISLVVGKNSNTKVLVPSLIGKSYTDAISILDSLMINYNAVFSPAEYTSAEDSTQAIVWKQRPFSGENEVMSLSEPLDFWVQPKSIAVEQE
ncbi:MAG: PASTA domain-containing protein [Bacteroidales bacterium]|jgi:beta-lactam-binding protein with PASTA domain|nr:PASTA domain-containing protein [Bacteroidales bacterium]